MALPGLLPHFAFIHKYDEPQTFKLLGDVMVDERRTSTIAKDFPAFRNFFLFQSIPG